MSVLLDTSVLIAGLLAAHDHHAQALPWLQKAYRKDITLCVSAHSLLETFAVLTRLPMAPKISPNTATHLIHENIEKNAEVIVLSKKEHLEILQQMNILGLTGGIIYDALILKAAEKAKVSAVITFNVRDFKRLCPQNPDWIQTP